MKIAEKPLLNIIKDHLKGTLEGLPVFNPVAIKIVQLLSRPNFSSSEASELVCSDQSLASQVLKMANSPYYSGLSSITTINDAIVRLGVQEVANIVMMASQFGKFHSGNEHLNSFMQKLWEHSLACATGAKWLAIKTGFNNLASESFMAGLLHDIGHLALIMVMDNVYLNSETKSVFTNKLLNDIFLTLHEEVGFQLMKSWSLPDKYCTIAYHHQSDFDVNNMLLVLVRLADQTCKKVGKAINPDTSISLVMAPEAQLLSMKEITLAELEIVIEDSHYDY
ncbi:MAG: HDOD domain-containing protein [Desulfuromonadaceae bacterium]|nr:HDOD domain-containing protein [Desulfuromonadaceae bacterium]MDD5106957.1 HDOD domain-containing protein [Desulfuromonadaceae bacterium]